VDEPRPIVLVAASEDADLEAIGGQISPDWLSPLAARSWASVEASLGDLALTAAIVHFKLQDVGNLDFCRRLRALPGRQQLPILLLLPGMGRPATPGEPFNLAMRFPAGPGVLADNLAKILVEGDAKLVAATQDLKAELASRLEDVDQRSYYQILDVQTGCSKDELTRAYDAFSLRFHPDRLKRLRGDPDLAARAEQFYLLLTEAYQTLSDSIRRQRYDAGLSAGKMRYNPSLYQTAHDLSQISQVDNARRYLRLAQKEMDKGDRQAALVFLKMARAVDPDNEEIKRRLDSL
jgi:hypothetical protein